VTPLAVAVERRDWRTAALYLLLGVVDAAEALPEASLAELLDLLGGEETGRDGDAAASADQG
jgi:hypothetical protein